MRYFLVGHLFLSFILCSNVIYASNNELALSAKKDFRIALIDYVSTYDDASSRLSVDDALTLISNNEFKDHQSNSLQFGLTKSSIWLTATIVNNTESTIFSNLEINHPPLVLVDIYLVNHNGAFKLSLP